jgi:NADH dehydrogenase FAD-containing subunit
VTLIDKRNYDLFRPTLYQVATGLLSQMRLPGPCVPSSVVRKNIDVLLDEVTGITAKQRTVDLKHRVLPCDAGFNSHSIFAERRFLQ